eukprot:211469-Chlamydomonas_euryale.AAC.3
MKARQPDVTTQVTASGGAPLSQSLLLPAWHPRANARGNTGPAASSAWSGHSISAHTRSPLPPAALPLPPLGPLSPRESTSPATHASSSSGHDGTHAAAQASRPT